MARHTRSQDALAMTLTRQLDAQGRPFKHHVARLAKWPQGLTVAMISPTNQPTLRHCNETLRNTGDIELARWAHQTRQVFYAPQAKQRPLPSPAGQAQAQAAPAQAAPAQAAPVQAAPAQAAPAAKADPPMPPWERAENQWQYDPWQAWQPWGNNTQ